MQHEVLGSIRGIRGLIGFLKQKKHKYGDIFTLVGK